MEKNINIEDQDRYNGMAEYAQKITQYGWFEFPDELKKEMIVLAKVMAYADEMFDRLLKTEQLESFQKALISFIKGEETDYDFWSNTSYLKDFKRLIDKRQVSAEFGNISQGLFDITNRLYHTTCQTEYIKLRYQEWIASYHVFKKFLWADIPKEIHNFLHAMVWWINLLDSATDIQEDREEGVVKVKPNLKFRAKLLFIFLQRMYKCWTRNNMNKKMTIKTLMMVWKESLSKKWRMYE